jgi:hypothetical protein
MRIRFLHASAGKVGTEKDVDDPSGRVLILLKKAEKVEAKKPEPSRAYKRRDLQAEQTVITTETQEDPSE